MFHVKQRRFVGLVVLVGLLGLLASGCVRQIGSRGWAAPVSDSGVIIVSTGGGRIDGIDSDGQRLWRFPELWNIPDKQAKKLKGIYGSPQIGTYDGKEVVFVGDYDGYVYAFRPGDYQEGSTVESPSAASFKLNGAVIGGIKLDTATDVLYITSDTRVYAIHASDLVARIDNRDAPVGAIAPPPEGESNGVLFKAGDEIWGTPVLADGKLLITSLDGGLYALDPMTGAVIWHFEAKQGLVSRAIVTGDTVLVSGFGSTLYAVNLADGSQKWSFKASHWIWGDAAVEDGVAYVGDFDGIVHAIDLSSGAEDWSLDLKHDALRASPVVTNGTLVVSSDSDWLVGIDTATHAVVWQRDVGTKMNADMSVDGASVLIAPSGCVTPEAGGDKVYYTKVNPLNGDLTFASGVC
jgi:outer membrane protein assembly factor BamB